jgi:hypothetical protein
MTYQHISLCSVVELYLAVEPTTSRFYTVPYENMVLRQMNALEKFFIQTLDSRDLEIGYNLAEGGLGGATREGCTNTEHQKLAVALALTGRPKSLDHRKHLSESKRGIPCPAVIESNIRRRSENPSKAALANRKYRAAKKEREAHA